MKIYLLSMGCVNVKSYQLVCYLGGQPETNKYCFF